MIEAEFDKRPDVLKFDVAVVAVGYERRCRWVYEKFKPEAVTKLGLEFGFLTEGDYAENRAFFAATGFTFFNGLRPDIINVLSEAIVGASTGRRKVFVDTSSMSREMIANVILAIQRARGAADIDVTQSYAPSLFSETYLAAPIRVSSPVNAQLAGWSSRPDKPLGTIFGLGCEPDLALGALQVLEPSKAWLFKPKGIDPQFDAALKSANEHLNDIFDTTTFNYQIIQPTATRARLEALISAVEPSFRLIVVPFGPKLFAWLAMASVVFNNLSSVGIWAFSSKESATPVNRDASGEVIWHTLALTHSKL